MMGHRRFMEMALEEARRAADRGEVPVGAVLVQGDRVIGRGHNLRETLGDPLAHAEILALREGARELGGWRLEGSTLYVTLEPCPMCAGALVLARVERLVFGARDLVMGAAGSRYNLVQDENLPHRVEVLEGMLEEECRELLRSFFRNRRGAGG